MALKIAAQILTDSSGFIALYQSGNLSVLVYWELYIGYS